MEPVINPMIFYWINTLDKLQTFFTILAFIIATIFLIVLIMAIVLITDNYQYGEDDDDYKTGKTLLKLAKRLLIPLLFVACVAIFIPSKTTCTEMLVAKFATYDNATWTIESLKEAVNYIVEQFALLK